jgi:hypothetical protein
MEVLPICWASSANNNNNLRFTRCKTIDKNTTATITTTNSNNNNNQTATARVVSMMTKEPKFLSLACRSGINVKMLCRPTCDCVAPILCQQNCEDRRDERRLFLRCPAEFTVKFSCHARRKRFVGAMVRTGGMSAIVLMLPSGVAPNVNIFDQCVKCGCPALYPWKLRLQTHPDLLRTSKERPSNKIVLVCYHY